MRQCHNLNARRHRHIPQSDKNTKINHSHIRHPQWTDGQSLCTENRKGSEWEPFVRIETNVGYVHDEKLLKKPSLLKFFSKNFAYRKKIYNFVAVQALPHSVAGQTNIDGILRPTMPFVGLGRGERTFSDVTICKFKLRNFDFKCRCNATKRLRGLIIFQQLLCIL